MSMYMTTSESKEEAILFQISEEGVSLARWRDGKVHNLFFIAKDMLDEVVLMLSQINEVIHDEEVESL